MDGTLMRDELNSFEKYLEGRELDELLRIKETINPEKYPDRYQMLLEKIDAHNKKVASDNNQSADNFNSVPYMSQLEDQVLSLIREKESPEQSAYKNIGFLIVSLLLFISLGFLQFSFSNLLIIVVVLLVHEAGHFIGMRAMGYSNVRMFFIPFFGAAVAGVERNPKSSQKAIVALLGPVPGILIGVTLIFIFFEIRQKLLLDIGVLFLVINAFNLLPLPPLDGGHLFDTLLFSNSPKLEVGFKLIACLGIAGLAIYLKALVLGVLAAMIFFSIRRVFCCASIAGIIRKELTPEESASTSVPVAQVKNILVHLKKRLIDDSFMDSEIDPKVFAPMTINIWQRVINRPASISATVGFFALYIFLWLICFLPYIWVNKVGG